MGLTVEVPDSLATFVRTRAQSGEQTPSDVVAQALMLLQDRDAAAEDVAWLREALAEGDPADEGEELTAADIIRDGEARLSALRSGR